MCGITGLLTCAGHRNQPSAAEIVAAMTAALRHRGPDDAGLWYDPDAAIALGHRRLSIVDLSPAGHQPMSSAGGRYVMVLNGEIYNYRGLRAELDGVAWRGHSDTEVLLAAMERWGFEAALRRSVGMFALAVWDRRERELLLARDRMGEKPLYYGVCGGSLAFGSEIKALRQHPEWSPEIDPVALSAFLRFGYVPAPGSIYRGIRKLAPGTWLRVSAARPAELPRPQVYWSAITAARQGAAAWAAPVSSEAATEELEALLREAVAKQMVADVPLGAFLSGGIDSSLVVALMQTQSSRPVKTFTIGFRESTHNEAPHAAAVARHLGTDHTELMVTDREARDVVPRLADIYDEPFADSSQIPTFLVAQLTRRSVTVSLSGDGGDEMFCGYDRYRVAERTWARLGWLPFGVRRSLGAAVHAVPPQAMTRLCRLPLVRGKAEAWRINGDRLHKFGDLLAQPRLEDLYRGLLSYWQDPSVATGAPDRSVAAGVAPTWDDGLGTMHNMMLGDTLNYLPDDILVKVDRAAMAVSLETRIPLLDHRVVEAAWRLPPALKVHGGESKWLLRRILRKHVPGAMFERPKMGFGVPIGPWLRGPLRDWASDLLDERRLGEGGLLAPAAITRRWREHLQGSRDWHNSLWVILMLQLWRANEAKPPGASPEAERLAATAMAAPAIPGAGR